MSSPHFDDDDQSLYLPRRRQPTSIPRTIGVLNIVFGCLLLLCAVCSSLNLMLQSAMGPMMAMQQQQIQQAIEAEQKNRLQELQDLEKAANKDEEKNELRAQQKALMAQRVPKMPDFGKVLDDPNLRGFMMADVVSGFIVNILLIISGMGLLGHKEWGRVSALWVAALKILRLIALYAFYALVVVPSIVDKFITMFKEFFDEVAKAAPPGQRVPPPPDFEAFGSFMETGGIVFAIAMIMLGVIYPVLVLILLTRPQVRAACAAPSERWD